MILLTAGVRSVSEQKSDLGGATTAPTILNDTCWVLRLREAGELECRLKRQTKSPLISLCLRDKVLPEIEVPIFNTYFVFLKKIIAILVNVKWYSIVVLIFIRLTMSPSLLLVSPTSLIFPHYHFYPSYTLLHLHPSPTSHNHHNVAHIHEFSLSTPCSIIPLSQHPPHSYQPILYIKSVLILHVSSVY